MRTIPVLLAALAALALAAPAALGSPDTPAPRPGYYVASAPSAPEKLRDLRFFVDHHDRLVRQFHAADGTFVIDTAHLRNPDIGPWYFDGDTSHDGTHYSVSGLWEGTHQAHGVLEVTVDGRTHRYRWTAHHRV
jgi:hypothetical protein